METHCAKTLKSPFCTTAAVSGQRRTGRDRKKRNQCTLLCLLSHLLHKYKLSVKNIQSKDTYLKSKTTLLMHPEPSCSLQPLWCMQIYTSPVSPLFSEPCSSITRQVWFLQVWAPISYVGLAVILGGQETLYWALASHTTMTQKAAVSKQSLEWEVVGDP